ncbi:hypothetical protein [Alteribacter populi]|uniref:hypothetical protein n=1 Tax=Alteribacter populi TaxID=2011011 RepID=UPI000BBB13B5|nr:hypothetical protein [Alteribacter populi]
MVLSITLLPYSPPVVLLYVVNPFFAILLGIVSGIFGKKVNANAVVTFLAVYVFSMVIMVTVQRMSFEPSLFGYALFNSVLSLMGFWLGSVAKKLVLDEE